VDNMRMELLHNEFMMLTPFRTSRTSARLDVTSKSCYCSFDLLIVQPVLLESLQVH